MFSRLITSSKSSFTQKISSIFIRGLKIYPSELRKGDWIEHDGRVLIVHHVNSSFSGRGSRQFLVTLKEVLSENFTTIKPTPKDTFEKLELQDVSHQFLYEADGLCYLLNPKNMEEITVPSRLIAPNLGRLLESGIEVKVRMNGEKPVMVHTPSRNIKCTVSNVVEKTLSKHDSGYPQYQRILIRIDVDRKAIIVETNSGAKITCTSAVNVGDRILINLDDMSYQGKAT